MAAWTLEGGTGARSPRTPERSAWPRYDCFLDQAQLFPHTTIESDQNPVGTRLSIRQGRAASHGAYPAIFPLCGRHTIHTVEYTAIRAVGRVV